MAELLGLSYCFRSALIVGAENGYRLRASHITTFCKSPTTFQLVRSLHACRFVPVVCLTSILVSWHARLLRCFGVDLLQRRAGSTAHPGVLVLESVDQGW